MLLFLSPLACSAPSGRPVAAPIPLPSEPGDAARLVHIRDAVASIANPSLGLTLDGKQTCGRRSPTELACVFDGHLVGKGIRMPVYAHSMTIDHANTEAAEGWLAQPDRLWATNAVPLPPDHQPRDWLTIGTGPRCWEGDASLCVVRRGDTTFGLYFTGMNGLEREDMNPVFAKVLKADPNGPAER